MNKLSRNPPLPLARTVAIAFLLLAAPIGIAGGLAIAPSAAILGVIFLVARIWPPAEKASTLPRADRLGRILAGLLILLFAWIALAAFRSPLGIDFSPRAILHENNQFWNFVLWAPLYVAGAYAFVRLGMRAPAPDSEGQPMTAMLLERAIVAFVWLSIALLLWEKLGNYPLTAPLRPAGDDPGFHDRSVSHGVSLLICWMWPALAILARRSLRAFGLTWFGALMVVWLYDYDAPRLAFALASFLYVAANIAPRILTGAAFLGVAASLVAAPFAVTKFSEQYPHIRDGLALSWQQRADVWVYLAQKIETSPIMGFGLNSAKSLNAAGETAGARIVALNHPHNAFLQIWLDLGGVGVGLVVLVLGCLGVAAVRRIQADRSNGSVIVGTLAANVVAAAINYGLWEEWWLATLTLSVGICTLGLLGPRKV